MESDRCPRTAGLRKRRTGVPWFLKDLAVVVGVSLSVFALFVEASWLLKKREIGERTVVEIPEGATVRGIASILERAGIVAEPDEFVLAARLLGFTDKLQAGSYEFGPRFSELEVLTALRHGEVAGRRVTIPEGYRASQIALLLESEVGMDATEFLRLVHDPDFIGKMGVSAPSLEGYLHPDTYRLRLDATPAGVIETMVYETKRFFDKRMVARAESLGMTVHEVLTLASIIEAEAMFDSERSRISAVYHNRLNHGWRLEADPTVRYAIGNYERKLYYGDLEIDSPYNTYRHAGLPPGPICNPGRASVMAALYPLPGCDEFFFVANGDGTHTFSRTFAEHVRARRRIGEKRAGKAFSLDTDGNG